MTMIVSPQGVDNHARTRGGVGVVVSIGEQVDGNERNTQKKKKDKKTKTMSVGCWAMKHAQRSNPE